VNRNWFYVVAGAALVAGGLALLARLQLAGGRTVDDPIAEAQRLLSKAQSTVSEIEAGLQGARNLTAQTA